MKQFIIISVLCFVSILVSSCEKVIEVDLNDAESRIVVEGYVSNDSTRQYVKLTRTGSFYEANNFPAVSGASVTIAEEGGSVYTLTEAEPRIYRYKGLTPAAGKKYSLNVTSGGESITADVVYPSPVPIDSIVTEFEPGGGFFTPGFTVYCYFTDNGSEKNYYRFKLYQNEEPVDYVWIVDDTYNDGTSGRYAFWEMQFPAQDTIRVEMLCIDKQTYLYYLGIQEVQQQGNESAAPGNPVTNIKGKALGIFAGANITKQQVVLGL